ncbi:MAG: hypothetical protein HUK22_06050, partial [Thermoguttaceae bacterium]|nr:hypothetical protein [Thermoguttaceae bacterium]
KDKKDKDKEESYAQKGKYDAPESPDKTPELVARNDGGVTSEMAANIDAARNISDANDYRTPSYAQSYTDKNDFSSDFSNNYAQNSPNYVVDPAAQSAPAAQYAQATAAQSAPATQYAQATAAPPFPQVDQTAQAVSPQTAPYAQATQDVYASAQPNYGAAPAQANPNAALAAQTQVYQPQTTAQAAPYAASQAAPTAGLDAYPTAGFDSYSTLNVAQQTAQAPLQSSAPAANAYGTAAPQAPAYVAQNVPERAPAQSAQTPAPADAFTDVYYQPQTTSGGFAPGSVGIY